MSGNEPQKRASLPLHWYLQSTDTCPPCGRGEGEVYRTRMLTPRPNDINDRWEHHTYCCESCLTGGM